MKKKIVYNIFLILILIAIFVTVIPNNILAFKAEEIYGGTNPFSDQTKTIVDLAKLIGTGCAGIMLTYIGIKFVLASPDGKAEIKKELPLWVIGCVLLAMPKLVDIIISSIPRSDDLNSAINDGVATVLGVFQAVGTSIAVIILVVLGIKYVLSSPDGKADLKQRAYAYILGAAFIFGAPWIATLVLQVAAKL